MDTGEAMSREIAGSYPNFASSQRFGENLVIFGPRMKVGFLDASPCGQHTGLFAGVGEGVVVKTLPFGTP
jgi:hypothetical protein